MKCLLASSILFTIALAQYARYDNYKLYSVLPTTEEQLQVLIDLEHSGLPLDYWSAPLFNITMDIMVPPHADDEFQNFLSRFQIKSSLKTDNLQRFIDECNPQPLTKTSEFDWTRYHDLKEINQWMENLTRRYSTNARLITVGRSFEGRDIRGIKVSFREGNKAVFIEGGIHAREWISPATVTYILNELLTSTNVNVRAMAESYDWYIVPSVNPDGYVYSHKTNRLWRRTRQPYGICTGADGNRNWDNHWNEIGTTDCCLGMYAGSHPFSEPETRSLSEYISTIADDLVVYLSIHSFGQLLLIPYGSGEYCDNYNELYEVGQKVIDSLRQRHGTVFTLGNWREILYASSGVSVDWVKTKFNVPFTYTIELRDKGLTGFLLPADQIIPVGEEMTDALVTLIEEVVARGY